MSGSIPILFADWDIPNPSFTGFVTTQNHGVLEFLLKLARLLTGPGRPAARCPGPAG